MIITTVVLVCLSSLADMNVDSEIGLRLNIRFQVGHLEVIIHPVHHKIWEPRISPLALEQAAKQLQAVLAKVVSKHLEAHQVLILCQCLREQGQTEIINVVVGHVNVHQRFVDCDSLSNCFCTVVAALVIS